MELLTPVSVPVIYGNPQNYIPGSSTASTYTTTTTSVETRTFELSRTDIVNLQRVLHSRGYYHGPINGIYTSSTRQALISFQDDSNLSQTGRIDTRTAELLGLNLNVVSQSPSPSPSSFSLSRADIMSLQKVLRTRGYYHGPINGVFTSSTRQALIDFQGDQDMSATGSVDFRTAELLGLNLSASSSSNVSSRYTGRSRVENIDPNGQPSFMGVGSTHRFIIWRDGNWWRVRTTTAGLEHNFDGHIEANGGTIKSISHTESLEDIDQLSLQRSRRVLDFDFTTAGAMDGFDFYTDADSLTFYVNMDGRRTERNVYIGRNGENPVSIPFTLANE